AVQAPQLGYRVHGPLGPRSPPPPPARGRAPLPEARPPVRRYQAVAHRARREVTRVLSGAVLLAIAVAAVWWASERVFFAVALVVTFAASHELMDLARASGLTMPRFPAVFAAALVLAATVCAVPASMLAVALMAALLALGLLTLGAWHGGRDALATVSASLLPSIYIALPVAALVTIRAEAGPPPLFLLMLTVMISDTAQYYSGRAFGRRLLPPPISPQQTLHGAIR